MYIQMNNHLEMREILAILVSLGFQGYPQFLVYHLYQVYLVDQPLLEYRVHLIHLEVLAIQDFQPRQPFHEDRANPDLRLKCFM